MKKNGFTLIEILVAATIIAVLSLVGVASYTSINKRSRDVRRKSDLEQVRSALEMYRTDTGAYPNVAGFDYLTKLQPYLVPKYMPSIPVDPKSTAQPPFDYFYIPLPLGTVAPYYSYCICADLESEAGSNTCGVTNGSFCNYYLKNP